ncbi:hypothetical protein HY061_02270 [Candidatus Azambacteria bacterium]|nr:hypothetical protein [Candidatus Azambacteria bacterium]
MTIPGNSGGLSPEEKKEIDDLLKEGGAADEQMARLLEGGTTETKGPDKTGDTEKKTQEVDVPEGQLTDSVFGVEKDQNQEPDEEGDQSEEEKIPPRLSKTNLKLTKKSQQLAERIEDLEEEKKLQDKILKQEGKLEFLKNKDKILEKAYAENEVQEKIKTFEEESVRLGEEIKKAESNGNHKQNLEDTRLLIKNESGLFDLREFLENDPKAKDDIKKEKTEFMDRVFRVVLDLEEKQRVFDVEKDKASNSEKKLSPEFLAFMLDKTGLLEGEYDIIKKMTIQDFLKKVSPKPFLRIVPRSDTVKMPMSNTKRIEGTGWVIDDINKRYKEELKAKLRLKEYFKKKQKDDYGLTIEQFFIKYQMSDNLFDVY